MIESIILVSLKTSEIKQRSGQGYIWVSVLVVTILMFSLDNITIFDKLFEHFQHLDVSLNWIMSSEQWATVQIKSEGHKTLHDKSCVPG